MKWFALIAGLVLVVWGLTWIFLILVIDDPGERGQFGDMFGSTNSLFSGLAFAGVIIAIFYQRQELQLQREELAETRQEIRRSAEAQEQQVKAQERAALFNARATLIQTFAGTARRNDYVRDQIDKLMEGVRELEENA